jgi:AcrR family transcriptional regulator
MARRDVKTEMISGAGDLLATHGVQGASFSLVIEKTGVPRGSIYHHFPGGKTELVQAAVLAVGAAVTSLIDAVEADSPVDVVSTFVEGWRASLNGGHFERGCAVAAASNDATGEPSIRTAANEVFTSWREALSRAFVRSGVERDEADDFATLCIAATEGALVLGRAARSDEVFDVLARQLPRFVGR